MKNKTSTGHDGISPRLIKQIGLSLATPLSHVFNLSFVNGQFPTKMKLAEVIPIYKSGDPELTNNYRPISLLPTFSKLLERLMFNRLYNYCKINNILIPEQFGFREHLSTEQAILELQDIIVNNINHKLWTLGIFLDLSKAFDTLDYSILFTKLNHYGIRGTALNWFKSYLTARSQYIKIGSSQSNQQNITCGVPQGSILGPLLFILYINDITQSSNLGKFLIFADDTNILYT